MADIRMTISTHTCILVCLQTMQGVNSYLYMTETNQRCLQYVNNASAFEVRFTRFKISIITELSLVIITVICVLGSLCGSIG